MSLYHVDKVHTHVDEPYNEPMYLEQTYPGRPFRIIHSMLSLGASEWHETTCEIKGRKYRETIIGIYHITIRIFRSHLKQPQEL